MKLSNFKSLIKECIKEVMDESPLYVEYIKDMPDEQPFMLNGKKYQYVWAKYPGGKRDIGVYAFSGDVVYSYDAFNQMHNIKQNIEEVKDIVDVIVLLPGGFKPPHVGHLQLANAYANDSHVESVLVMVGPKQREGVTREQSIKIWKLLTNNPKIQIVPVPFNNPLQACYEYVFALPKNETANVVMGASNKGRDALRSKDFVKNINGIYKMTGTESGQKVPQGVRAVELNVDVTPLTYSDRTDGENGNPISATVLRKDVENRDFKNFVTNYPGISMDNIKRIYEILTKNALLKEYIKKLMCELTDEELKDKIKPLMVKAAEAKKQAALMREKEMADRLKSAQDEEAVAKAGGEADKIKSADEKIKSAKDALDAAKVSTKNALVAKQSAEKGNVAN